MANWVKTSKNLPAENGYYLGYMESGIKHTPCIRRVTFFNARWTSIEGCAWPDMPQPTYWQELPESPNRRKSQAEKWDGKEIPCKTCEYGEPKCAGIGMYWCKKSSDYLIIMQIYPMDGLHCWKTKRLKGKMHDKHI